MFNGDQHLDNSFELKTISKPPGFRTKAQGFTPQLAISLALRLFRRRDRHRDPACIITAWTRVFPGRRISVARFFIGNLLTDESERSAL